MPMETENKNNEQNNTKPQILDALDSAIACEDLDYRAKNKEDKIVLSCDDLNNAPYEEPVKKYPFSINSSYIEIIDEKCSKNVNPLRHTINFGRTIRYDDLYSHEKEKLRFYSLDQFDEATLYEIICECVKGRKNRYCVSLIGDSIVAVSEEIKNRCACQSSLFAGSAEIDEKVYTIIENKFGIDEIENIRNLDANILGRLLIIYLSEFSGGIAPQKVMRLLLRLINTNNVNDLRKLFYYFPFIFTPTARVVLINIIEITKSRRSVLFPNNPFAAIEEVMDVFLPPRYFKDEKNAENLIQMLFLLKYERVPIEFLNKE